MRGWPVPYPQPGSEFTAADIMNVFTLTTMRYFQPWDSRPDISTRWPTWRASPTPAYIAAMAKDDPGMRLPADVAAYRQASRRFSSAAVKA